MKFIFTSVTNNVIFHIPTAQVEIFFPPFRAGGRITHNADNSGATGRARGTVGFHGFLVLQTFNSQVKYELLKNETDIVDLLGLTCLQVFEPTIYSRLPNYKNVLCGPISNYSYERQKAEESEIEKAINTLTVNGEITENIDLVKKILGILFPKVQSAIEFTFGMGRNYAHKKFLVNNNIAVSACFDRYFSLSLESEAIPTSIIKKLIYEVDEADFIEGVDQIYKEGKITRFLEEIEAYANKGASITIPSERAVLLFKLLVCHLLIVK